MGEAWDALPPAVRRMHELDVTAAEGVAQVERGDHPLARLIGTCIGVPPAGRDVPLRVSFKREGETEIWRRSFGGRSFVSRQACGRAAGLKVERFGPITLWLAMEVEGERLRIGVRRWAAFGLPLPLSFAPVLETYEAVEDGRFVFDDDIRHPLVGRIARHRGWLEPVEDAG
nr:DUF4166 domain-containing protein [Caulobacter sp. 17J80-11]